MMVAWQVLWVKVSTLNYNCSCWQFYIEWDVESELYEVPVEISGRDIAILDCIVRSGNDVLLCTSVLKWYVNTHAGQSNM